MIKIRYSRIRKFGKKNRKFMVTVQLIAIFYFIILTTGYLTSDTGAYFNDSSQVNGILQAGTWQEKWDKSSLAFPNKDQTVTGVGNGTDTCQQIEISTDIFNNGSDMQGNSTYEVYYIASGNPKLGEKVGGGITTPILSNKSEKLIYLAAKPGNYKFRGFQRPGHANKYDTPQDLWSETINLTCPIPSPGVTQQNQLNNQSNSPVNTLGTGSQLDSQKDSDVQNNSIKNGTQSSASNTNLQDNTSNGDLDSTKTNSQGGTTSTTNNMESVGNGSSSP